VPRGDPIGDATVGLCFGRPPPFGPSGAFRGPDRLPGSRPVAARLGAAAPLPRADRRSRPRGL